MGSRKKTPKQSSPKDQEQRIALFRGDNAEGIKQIKDNSIDTIIIDPNYGINSKKIDFTEWLESILLNDDYVRGGEGFNGNKWDADLPRLTHFEDQLRVLKPGGFMACFANARRDHYVKTAIERVGFDLKEPINWLRTNGTFSRPAKNQKKYGESNLRIINEPIIIAQKPIEKGLTTLENFKKYGTGFFNSKKVLSPSGSPTTNLIYENDPALVSKIKSAAQSGYCLPTDSIIAEQKTMAEREYGLELINENAKRFTAIDKVIAHGANKHDTTKPIELMRFLVRLLSFENSIVLDTYMGSGTCGVASLLENRRFYGMEMESDYFYISTVRIHTVFYREIFLKNKCRKKSELQWHLDGLKLILEIAKENKVSSSWEIEIKKMISAVKTKIK